MLPSDKAWSAGSHKTTCTTSGTTLIRAKGEGPSPTDTSPKKPAQRPTTLRVTVTSQHKERPQQTDTQQDQGGPASIDQPSLSETRAQAASSPIAGEPSPACIAPLVSEVAEKGTAELEGRDGLPCWAFDIVEAIEISEATTWFATWVHKTQLRDALSSGIAPVKARLVIQGLKVLPTGHSDSSCEVD